jgi:hypothetical protein
MQNKSVSLGPLGLWGADPDECDKLGKCMSPGGLNPATLHSGLETVKPSFDAALNDPSNGAITESHGSEYG